MAFTVKGEYERLLKIQERAEKKSKDKCLAFMSGCICGRVTKIEYVPWSSDQEECINIYVFTSIAGFNAHEHIALVLTENDVNKRYQDRKYKYWKRYDLLESFVR